MIKAHKIRLNPTSEQEQYFWQAAGIARHAWNWGLSEYNKRLAETGKFSKIIGKGDTLRAEFAARKNELWPWVGDVTAHALPAGVCRPTKSIFQILQTAKGRWAEAAEGLEATQGWPAIWLAELQGPQSYDAQFLRKQ